jgi:hypothetical protein
MTMTVKGRANHPEGFVEKPDRYLQKGKDLLKKGHSIHPGAMPPFYHNFDARNVNLA